MGVEGELKMPDGVDVGRLAGMDGCVVASEKLGGKGRKEHTQPVSMDVLRIAKEGLD